MAAVRETNPRRHTESYEASTNTNGAQSRDTSAKISGSSLSRCGRDATGTLRDTRVPHAVQPPTAVLTCHLEPRTVHRPSTKLTYSFRTPLIVTNVSRLALRVKWMCGYARLDGQKHMPLFVTTSIWAGIHE